jgi:hypothetical protein
MFRTMLIAVLLFQGMSLPAFAQKRWVNEVRDTSKKNRYVLVDAGVMTDVVFFRSSGSQSARASIAIGKERFNITDSADLKWLRSVVSDQSKPWIRVDWVDPKTNLPAANENAEKYWRWSDIVYARSASEADPKAFLEMWATGQVLQNATTIRVSNRGEVDRVLKLMTQTRQ